MYLPIPHPLASLLLLLLSILPPSVAVNYSKQPSKDAVLLSNIQTLTLRANRKTTARRVSAIPQLSCVGPPKVCALYNVDVMRCVNAGADYDENDVQWTCTANVPEEFKLGSTDVVCEGYRNADDPWVLKGSCGVEYRLLLTDKGEQRYGKIAPKTATGATGSAVDDRSWPEYLFDVFMGIATVTLIVGVFAVICSGASRAARARGNGFGNGWFGGGGGGGGWGPPGPPPPYDYQPPGYFSKGESWRPGFWSGALGGAAAGYAMGRGSSAGRRSDTTQAGPSNWTAGPSRSPSSSSSSNRVESTGFGSTRRR